MSGSVEASSKACAELGKGTVLYFSPSDIHPEVKEFYDASNKPRKINKALLESPLQSNYTFTHKAIWAVTLPHIQGDSVFKFEHWAFVAKGSFQGMAGFDAYFVAQYSNGDYIPKEEERNEEKSNGQEESRFSADLAENNKKHAALRLCSTKKNTNVWARLPDYTTWPDDKKNRQRLPDELESTFNFYKRKWLHKGSILEYNMGNIQQPRLIVSENFDESQWKKMENPLKLGDLNELMYKTNMAGRTYNPLTKNCHMFADSMFRLAW